MNLPGLGIASFLGPAAKNSGKPKLLLEFACVLYLQSCMVVPERRSQTHELSKTSSGFSILIGSAIRLETIDIPYLCSLVDSAVAGNLKRAGRAGRGRSLRGTRHRGGALLTEATSESPAVATRRVLTVLKPLLLWWNVVFDTSILP